VEQTSDLLAPVHEERIKHMIEDVVVEGFLEFLAEDVVVFVESR